MGKLLKSNVNLVLVGNVVRIFHDALEGIVVVRVVDGAVRALIVCDGKNNLGESTTLLCASQVVGSNHLLEYPCDRFWWVVQPPASKC